MNPQTTGIQKYLPLISIAYLLIKQGIQQQKEGFILSINYNCFSLLLPFDVVYGEFVIYITKCDFLSELFGPIGQGSHQGDVLLVNKLDTTCYYVLNVLNVNLNLTFPFIIYERSATKNCQNGFKESLQLVYCVVYMIDSVILVFPRIIDIRRGRFACDRQRTDEYNDNLSLSYRLTLLRRSIQISLFRNCFSKSFILFRYPKDMSRYYFNRSVYLRRVVQNSLQFLGVTICILCGGGGCRI